MEGIEKGETCNRNGCKGIIEEFEKEGGCSCHINPPCNYCEHDPSYCPECGWNAEDEKYSYEQNQLKKITQKEKDYWKEQQEKWEKSKKQFYDLYTSSEPVDKLNYRSESHTHFTMKKFGMFPLDMEREDVFQRVQGTFGGRFEYFDKDRGRFSFISYTD